MPLDFPILLYVSKGVYKQLKQATWKRFDDVHTYMGVQRLPHDVTTYEATQKTVWIITNYAEKHVILFPRQIPYLSE